VAARADRSGEVSRVLVRVFLLNLAVAVAKIGLGLSTGAVSVLSDGFHSLTDTASNVVALVGVRLARRPPDDNHPYGHRKFETMASVAILLFLILVLLQVVGRAWEQLHSRESPVVEPVAFVVMGVTLLVNLAVVGYERAAARRLQSEVLAADAHHTMSDVFTSITVIAALIGVALGYPLLDPIVAFLVAGFIGYACWQISSDTSRILSDAAVIPEDEIRAVVEGIPEILGCHKIRTRGSRDFAFLDLHIWMDGRLPLDEAHRLSHVVKDRLMARFPQIKDAVIHIEPPPSASLEPEA
jgi:cation diffusion facilitator family transporter